MADHTGSAIFYSIVSETGIILSNARFRGHLAFIAFALACILFHRRAFFDSHVFVQPAQIAAVQVLGQPAQ
jgi:hypothetical protein